MLALRFREAARTRARSLFGVSSELLSDRRGTTAVEFAIVSVPFFIILCSIFEAAFLVFNQTNLEYATAEAARQLLTGAIQTNGQSTTDQLATFKTNFLCPKLWGSFTCNNVVVDVRSGADFTTSYNTSSDFTAPTFTTQFSPGTSGQVVVVRVGYPYQLYFNKFGGMGGGSKMIMATAVFKSENY
jgi:Flp pilus assembly protein TadG